MYFNQKYDGGYVIYKAWGHQVMLDLPHGPMPIQLNDVFWRVWGNLLYYAVFCTNFWVDGKEGKEKGITHKRKELKRPS